MSEKRKVLAVLKDYKLRLKYLKQGKAERWPTIELEYEQFIIPELESALVLRKDES